MMHDERLAELIGCTTDKADNQFTVDNVVTQLESQLINKPDIVIPELVADTTFNPVITRCIDADVYFAFDCNFPNEDDLALCYDYDKFAGGVTADQYGLGVQIAELAAEAGNKTAVILTAAVGDPTHELRTAGFTEKFEELGGEVLQVQHCSDPSEAVTKATDLLTAQSDADCIYSTGGDFLSGAVSVKQAQGLDITMYGTNVNPDYLPFIKDGTVVAINGGDAVSGSLAMALAINMADGHPILDEEGKAPMFANIQDFLITEENVDVFTELYAGGNKFISDDQYKSLLYRYNPEVSYDSWVEFLTTYGDNVVANYEG